jgi:hypothetical protein
MPLLACIVLAGAACRGGEAPPPTAEGEGEGEGEGDAVGEACGDAIAVTGDLAEGVTIEGTTAGATDAVVLSCNRPSTDRVYRIDLTEESSLNIVGGALGYDNDVAIGVFGATCEAVGTQNCRQAGFSEVYLDLPVLAPGSYFIVVEGVGGPVDFWFTATRSASVCLGDPADDGQALRGRRLRLPVGRGRRSDGFGIDRLRRRRPLLRLPVSG